MKPEHKRRAHIRRRLRKFHRQYMNSISAAEALCVSFEEFRAAVARHSRPSDELLDKMHNRLMCLELGLTPSDQPWYHQRAPIVVMPPPIWWPARGGDA
jgi:hypothetical protein